MTTPENFSSNPHNLPVNRQQKPLILRSGTLYAFPFDTVFWFWFSVPGNSWVEWTCNDAQIWIAANDFLLDTPGMDRVRTRVLLCVSTSVLPAVALLSTDLPMPASVLSASATEMVSGIHALHEKRSLPCDPLDRAS